MFKVIQTNKLTGETKIVRICDTQEKANSAIIRFTMCENNKNVNYTVE